MSPCTLRTGRTAMTVIALTLALATGSAAAEEARMAARYDAARVEYEIGHYQLAFDELAALADGGHCAANRMARQMLRHGRALYGIDFQVAAERLARWGQAPACIDASPAPR